MTVSITAKSLVEESVTLFSLPDIYFQVDKMVHDPKYSAIDVGGVLSKDPALSIRLLKVVNSAYYGFPARIDTISRAITVIGIEDLQHLVLVTAIVDKFTHIPDSILDMTAFWLRSIKCGMIARLLAKKCAILHSERLFLMGLLHDIGLLVLLNKDPAKSLETLLMSSSDRQLLFATEKEIFGFTHTEVGAELIRSWGLPDALYHAIANYRNPERVLVNQLDTYILGLAANLCDLVEQKSSVESVFAQFFDEVQGFVDLDVEQVNLVIEQAGQECLEMFDVLVKKS